MKQKCKGLAWGILYFGLALFALQAFPIYAAADAFNFDVSLNKQNIMLGEPLLLTTRLKNTSAYEVVPDLTNRKTKWLRVTVIDDNNTYLPAVSFFAPVYLNGPSSELPLFPMKSGGIYSVTVVVTRQTMISKTGHYRIHVQVAFPYYQDGAERQSNAVLDKEPPLGAFEQEQTFNLTVTKPDDAQLRGVAETYRQKSLNERNGTNQWNAVKALFSMPESVALGAWKALVDAWPNSIVYEELMRSKTPARAELLADIAINPKSDDIMRSMARGSLRDMYMSRKQIGNPALEPALKKILLRLDGKLPEDR